ncbi:GroES-like protein [Gloeophyllum trabeum ATCC 11539]|uniref:alcohol dehydrogenase n=1 Tax=Gloeophyllum trabeum (strain ATCC 11539 / FP-39264 / Madison 617) TaxID=670483 RepID=S7RDZ1_GLOTA|nr:GroES-like protein [Gloeophyllum trabeum ATCC 11539]EPQ50664.1 GroES-like protein [Gloeophyllum trabeum ATCC 11539]
MSTEIPKTQRAALVVEYGKDLVIKNDHPVVQPNELKPGECLVKLEVTGVCHSDLSTKLGNWGYKPPLPVIPGHEGIGRVVAIGQGTVNPDVKIGDRVGLKWVAETCLRCEMCRRGEESMCPNQKVHGYKVDGTFQEYCVSWVDHVTPIPDTISSEEAVCMLCAGLTVWKALKQTNTVAGNWVVVPGAGGGLGHLAVQYAAYMGLRVVAIDGGEEKRKLCFELGAEKFIDFREAEDIVGEVKKATDGLGPHAAIVTAASGKAYEQAVWYLRERGTLVAVGMPPTDLFNIPIVIIVAKALRIVGSAIGDRQDAIEAMDIAARGKVRCHYEVDKLDNINKIFDAMQAGKLVGRVVIKY